MNWRVIVRMSLTGKNQIQLRNPVVKCLKACGLKSVGTATWESKAVSSVDAAKQFCKLLELLSEPTKAGARRAELEHLWIYIDRAKPPKAKPTPAAFSSVNK